MTLRNLSAERSRGRVDAGGGSGPDLFVAFAAAWFVIATAGPALAVPTIASILPSNGPTSGGAMLTINGGSFSATGNSASVDGVACPVVSEGAGRVLCTIPAGTGASNAVQVTDALGTASNTLNYSYDPPVVSSLTPGNGPTLGGVRLTINGNNFGAVSADAARGVTVGTAACALVLSASDHTTISCTLPPGQGLGRTVNVNVDGQVGNALTFDYDGPEITSITPSEAPTAGGVPLTINGSNFGLLATVAVGGSDCGVTLQSHTNLVCTSPPGSGSGVSVDVAVSGQHATTAISYRDPACGDGVVDPGETCDDHNAVQLDGCSAACESEHIEGKGQAACIAALNKAGAAVSKAEAAAIADCAKNAASGTACIGVAPSSAVDAAASKVVATFDKKCAALPDFGPVDAGEVSDLSSQAELALAHDIFGTDPDAVLAPDATAPGRAACQQAVLKAWDKLAAASLKPFGKCKKIGLKGQTIRAASQLAACLDYIDADAGVGKAASALLASLTDSCVGEDLALAFPGVCAASSSRGDCIEARVRCRTCLALTAMDHFGGDCDRHDNGAADGSCP